MFIPFPSFFFHVLSESPCGCKKSKTFAASQGYNKSLAYYMRTGLLLLYSAAGLLPAGIPSKQLTVMTISHNTLLPALYVLPYKVQATPFH
jgi:hypothetical protein